VIHAGFHSRLRIQVDSFACFAVSGLTSNLTRGNRRLCVLSQPTAWPRIRRSQSNAAHSTRAGANDELPPYFTDTLNMFSPGSIFANFHSDQYCNQMSPLQAGVSNTLVPYFSPLNIIRKWVTHEHAYIAAFTAYHSARNATRRGYTADFSLPSLLPLDIIQS
jgi:hypothetical protein